MIWREPWTLIVKNYSDLNALDDDAAATDDAFVFFNPIQLTRARAVLASGMNRDAILSALYQHTRTWFVKNWNDWDWPVDFLDELEKLSTDSSTGSIEKLNGKN